MAWAKSIESVTVDLLFLDFLFQLSYHKNTDPIPSMKERTFMIFPQVQYFFFMKEKMLFLSY